MSKEEKKKMREKPINFIKSMNKKRKIENSRKNMRRKKLTKRKKKSKRKRRKKKRKRKKKKLKQRKKMMKKRKKKLLLRKKNPSPSQRARTRERKTSVPILQTKMIESFADIKKLKSQILHLKSQRHQLKSQRLHLKNDHEQSLSEVIFYLKNKSYIEKNFIKLKLGFSHFVLIKIPSYIKVCAPKKTLLVLKSVDKQLLKEFSSKIRSFKLPDIYKGKGILYEGEKITLEFEGNITVSGEIITGSRNLRGEIILISFKNCTVTHNETILFHPDWGKYDMAVGKKIISAFSGPADVNSFDLITHVPSSETIKSKKTAEKTELEHLYQNIRNLREGKTSELPLETVFEIVSEKHPNDWLLSVEIAELLQKKANEILLQKVLSHLEKIKINRPIVAHLISGGLDLILQKKTI